MVGTDHTIAPLALRERLALDGKAAAQLLQGLHANHTVSEAALLSTCNRSEVYLVTTEPTVARELVRRAFAEALGEHAAGLDDLLIERQGPEAVRHLAAVAAGLQSMVVAESQILGQVRSAIEQAKHLGTSGIHLGTAFRAAIACGKRVRTETAIGHADISASSVLIDLLARDGIDWAAQRVLLIGAGRMNTVTAERLQALGAGEIVVTSRTAEAAAAMAAAVGGRAVPLTRIADEARLATLIVSATRSPGLMLTPPMLEGRRPHNLTIVDLAVPRDVDPTVGELPGVTLLDIDHLRDLQDRQGLTEALADAAAMVEEATKDWQTWCRTREAVPLIADLRAHVDRQKQAELTRTLAHLEHLSDEDRAAVGEMAHRLVNKMFHHLAVRMKQAAADPELGEHYMEAARYLFQGDGTDTREPAPIDEVHAAHPVR
ncbi:MAG: glutamyl-tRNA reductase [Chloroflexi bacterium]|nr:glutamyl-tRNA reductase [Chloroflexota bacterium]